MFKALFGSGEITGQIGFKCLVIGLIVRKLSAFCLWLMAFTVTEKDVATYARVSTQKQAENLTGQHERLVEACDERPANPLCVPNY